MPMKQETHYKLLSRKNEFGEWILRCYVNGKRYPNGDYYTDSFDDALDTLETINEVESSKAD